MLVFWSSAVDEDYEWAIKNIKSSESWALLHKDFSGELAEPSMIST